MSKLFRFVWLLLLCLAGACHQMSAQSGFVKSGDQAIPGATITAAQGDTTLSTVTDADGHYSFPPLASGTWNVTVDMFGFESLKKDVDFGAATGPVNFNLELKESPFLQRLRQFAARGNGSGGGPGGSGGRGPGNTGGGGFGGPGFGGGQTAGNNRAGMSGRDGTQQADQDMEEALNADQQSEGQSVPGSQSSNEALVVAGSLSPGMAQGVQADSGPDMRFLGGAPGEMGQGNANAPGFNDGAAGAGAAGGPGGGGFGGPGGGFGGGFGGGRGGRGGGGFGGPGGRGGRRPGQTAGATFGNRRRRNQQVHGQASFSLQNSALNAKPFSLTGLDVPQAAYAQSRFSFIVGGPLLIPKIVKDPNTQFFLTYFGTRAKTPQLFTETVPTALERSGDFSQATQSLGTSATNAPLLIVNPSTHLPFPGNVIPASMLSPISLGLLRYYPLPSQPGNANNYQFETAQASNTDNLGVRLQRNITKKDRLALNFQFQNRNGTSAQPFGYSDTNSGYGTNVSLQWMRNITPTALNTAQVRFNRNVTRGTPFFSLGPDVAAELGISGTSTNPINNGPPTLNFTNFAALSDGIYSLTRNQNQSGTESVSILKGLHSITLGVSYTRADLSTLSDPNGRGTFSFTGIATSILSPTGQPQRGTGYDLADFLLGFPQSSSIRYGDTDNYFYQNQYVGYAQDEWKARANLTLTMGLRYEYFSPYAQKYGRMANLDIAPDFAAVAVVTPNQPGPYSGAFPYGLINPDHSNFSPRVGIAWKLPWTKRSTVVRAGYGIYYNEQVYVQLASQLAQQPPFATSSAVNTSVSNPLSLEKGFLTTSPQQITNTFAVNRYYQTPYAGTWNASIQHDFSQGFFVEASYLGTKGTHLDVRILPNEAPPGSTAAIAEPTQLGNAVGFTFDEPVGNSIFNALQLRAVRRFGHGLSFNAYYQFAKSIDDSSTFGGAGNTVAQNWLNIEAERGLSSFDVRHELQTSFVWSSPVGTPRSRIASDSKLGRLLKDWQLSGGITAQTGNPLTARVLGNTAQLAQTGGIGSQRAEATGLSEDSSSGFFNVDAFTVPPAGTYGNAGRNTIEGPGLFNINLAFARSFNLAERRRIEFRVESNNVLNHVNYTNLYTVVNAINYGLPSAAGSMRTFNAVVRFRF